MNIIVISQHLLSMQTPRAHRSTELIKELSIRGHSITLFSVLGDYYYSSFSKQYNITVKPIRIYYQLKPYNSDGFKKRHLIDKNLNAYQISKLIQNFINKGEKEIEQYRFNAFQQWEKNYNASKNYQKFVKNLK